MLRFLPLLLLLGLSLAACDPTTDPGTTNPPAPNTVAMKNLTDLPMAGGDVTGIAITQSNTAVVALDGKLYSMSLTGGAMQLINDDAKHTVIGLAPSGELYALTDKEIRAYDLAAGTYKSVPIDPAGPLAINRRVEQAEFTFSPSGEPYVRMINNTPQTYIYRTADKGVSWTAVKLPPGFVYGGGFTFARNGDMLLSGAFGFYRSSNGGESWSTSPAPLANYSGEMLATANGDIFYYVRGGGGLRVSHDGGTSFSDLAQFNRSPYFVNLQEGTDGALYALAGRSAGSGDPIERPTSLLRSTDGGVTWRHVFFAQARVMAMRGADIVLGLGMTGFGAGRTHGGLAISRDRGATWRQDGTTPVQQVTDVGFDRSGNLMILADNGLFRKTAAGWRSFGTQPGLFARFATMGSGAMVIVNTGMVFSSNDDGATWTESPVTDYVPGIDPASVTTLLSLKSGEMLMSITSYSDTRGYSNGHIYHIGSDGVPKKYTGATQAFAKIVQDRNGTLYGGTSTVDGFTQQFTGRAFQSTDGGATWTEQQRNPAAWAFNSRNRYFAVNGTNAYSMNTLGSDQKTELTLQGFSSQGNYVTRVMFGPDDRLCIVTLDKGLFISDAPLQ